MTGGIIKENTCKERGAVTLWNNSTFILDGGIIRNNQSALSDGGLFKATGTIESTYTYKSGTFCENTPANQYETSTTCPN